MGNGSGIRASRAARRAGAGTGTAASAARRARILRRRGVVDNAGGRTLVRRTRARQAARRRRG